MPGLRLMAALGSNPPFANDAVFALARRQSFTAAQIVRNSRTFCTFLTARAVNPPGSRKKYRRDTDV